MLMFRFERFVVNVSHGWVDVDVVPPEELWVDVTYPHVAAIPRVQLLCASETVSVLRRGERRNLLRFLLKRGIIYVVVQVKAKNADLDLQSNNSNGLFPLTVRFSFRFRFLFCLRFLFIIFYYTDIW